MKDFINLPEVVNTNDIYNGRFYVVVPEETTNLILNPSFESVYADDEPLAGYTSLVVDKLLATDMEKSRGFQCARIETVSETDSGLYYLTESMEIGIYTFALDLKGVNGYEYEIKVMDEFGYTDISSYTFIATGAWERVYLVYSDTTGGAKRLYLTELSSINDAHYFYTDGWQLEEKNHPTTYCDGDQRGLLAGEKSYWWNGAPNNSTSYRSPNTRSGGVEYSFDDMGISILAVQGLGYATIMNQVEESVSGGAVFKNSVPVGSEISIATRIYSDDNRDSASLLRKRSKIAEYFRYDLTNPPQPLILRYRKELPEYHHIPEAYNIYCVSTGGFEGMWDSTSDEQIILKFTQYKPYIESDYDKGIGLLGHENLLTFSTPAGGTPNTRIYRYDTVEDEWTEIGYANQGITTEYISGIYVRADGVVFIWGSFTNISGVSCKNIAKYESGSWSAVGDANNPVPTDLVANNLGHVYITGSFASIGALSVNHVAKWNGAAWEALGAGLSGTSTFFSSVYGKALFWSATRNMLFVGGSFTTAGATTVNGLARWDGGAWNAAGSGISASSAYTTGYVNDIEALEDDDEVLIIAGKFSEGNGAYIYDYTNNDDLDLPGGSASYPANIAYSEVTKLTKFIDEANLPAGSVNGFGVWVGSFSGIGKTQSPRIIKYEEGDGYSLSYPPGETTNFVKLGSAFGANYALQDAVILQGGDVYASVVATVGGTVQLSCPVMKYKYKGEGYFGNDWEYPDVLFPGFDASIAYLPRKWSTSERVIVMEESDDHRYIYFVSEAVVSGFSMPTYLKGSKSTTVTINGDVLVSDVKVMCRSQKANDGFYYFLENETTIEKVQFTRTALVDNHVVLYFDIEGNSYILDTYDGIKRNFSLQNGIVFHLSKGDNTVKTLSQVLGTDTEHPFVLSYKERYSGLSSIL